MVQTTRLTLSRVAPAGAIAASTLLTTPFAARAQQQQGSVRALGIDTASFDHAIRPQDDFFRYVNGTWLAKTEIPADRSSELRRSSICPLRTAARISVTCCSTSGSIPLI